MDIATFRTIVYVIRGTLDLCVKWTMIFVDTNHLVTMEEYAQMLAPTPINTHVLMAGLDHSVRPSVALTMICVSL